MRRTLVIVLTVAVLGSLTLYTKDRQTHASTSASISQSSASSGQPTSSSSSQSTAYKDGIYNGSASETPYGTVQVAVVVNAGKITNINFLQMPNDQPHSQEVTNVSKPILKQETLNTQSANIDFVSGATSTSFGYQESLQAALDQAKIS